MLQNLFSPNLHAIVHLTILFDKTAIIIVILATQDNNPQSLALTAIV
jgi:hypothetical protein